jgi:hypothetical protein
MIGFGHDNKVFNSIVVDNPVNMVNNLVGSKVPSKMFFNNESVCHNAVTRILVRMPVSVLHNIPPISGNVTRMERINELEPILSGYAGNVVSPQSSEFSNFLGTHFGSSHVPQYINGNVFMGTVRPGYVKSFQINEDKLLGNSVPLGNTKHGSEFFVILPKLFFGDEQFSFHDGTVSPYSLMSSKEASRYSQDLQETVRKEDKEPLDNISEIKNQGDTVIIRQIGDITISDYQIGQKLNYERLESTAIELLIDKGSYFAFTCDDVIAYQSDIKLMNEWSRDAAEQMKITIDGKLLRYITYGTAGTFLGAAANTGLTAGAISSGYNMGTLAAPVQITKSNILEYFADMNGILDEQNVPEQGRWAVIPSWMTNMLLKSDIKDASMTGEESTLPNGRIGKIFGTTLYKSNNLYSSSSVYYVPFGTNMAATFATQITKMESLRAESTFGDLVRGLNVYGYKVIKPEALGLLCAKK